MAKVSSDTSEGQRILAEFVSREVHYNVSGLVSDLAKWPRSECYDDILSVCVADDWESAAYDEGWRYHSEPPKQNCYRDETDGQTWCCADWRELCEEFDIEPHTREAYEHWIVSDGLADKLAERGEMVSKDIHGLTVWGRCCTGQAICLDGVIADIYNTLHP